MKRGKMTSTQILSKEEEKIFNQKPIFTLSQQKYYFAIPKRLLEKIDSNHNKIYFVLLFGYFKATNKFFNNLDSDENMEYIASDILKISNWIGDNTITKTTFHRYKQIIKQHLFINEYTAEIKTILLNEAIDLASKFTHRKRIFYSLVELSKKLKIEVPSYTELSHIITLSINSQKKDILEKLVPLMKDPNLELLDKFLEKDEEYKNRWNLTHYKILEHGTNKQKMVLSLQKFISIQSNFNSLKKIIETVGITSKIAEYHARWIEKSQVFQVKRKKDVESNFLLLGTSKNPTT